MKLYIKNWKLVLQLSCKRHNGSVTKWIQYSVVVLAIILLAACSEGKTDGVSLPPMKETYARDDKNPFGGYVAYNVVQHLYKDQSMKVKKEPFEKTWAKIYDTGSLYFIAAPQCYASEEDAEAMLNYVKAGNDLFIAAGAFSDELLDRVGVKLNNTTALLDMLGNKMAETLTKLHPSVMPDTSNYSYYYTPFSAGFTGLPAGESRILGYNKSGSVNCFVYFYGKGKLFMHCEPRAFSNYFLLQRNNYQYLQHLLGLSRQRPEEIYWNDYYRHIKKGKSTTSGNSSKKSNEGSTFDGLKGSLLTAFLLVLFLLLLYVIDGVKRRQRIIPVRKPNENTSVTFTETVGLLYLQKKDNKNISEKMITYFNEFVRNQYFLNTSHVNELFLSTLSRKSGVPQDKVTELYETIATTQHKAVIDDMQLLTLNQHIQNFYKYRN